MHNGLTLLFPALLAAVSLIAGEPPAKQAPKQTGPAARVWFRRAAEFASSDLLARVLISLIAILLMLDLMLWFPDLGALIEHYEQF